MIELHPYTFYALLEAVIVLLGIILFLYFRLKKYKPYFQASVDGDELHRRYLKKAIQYTRNHARKLSGPAQQGDKTAIKHRQQLVARLNWLALERDFVSTKKPNETYWYDINNKIAKLLDRWQLLEFIEELPDTGAVDRALSREPGEHHEEIHEINKGTVEFNNIDPATLKELENLKKQVRNLNSYKGLYLSQQNAYRDLVDSYKNLKSSVSGLEMEAENAGKLRDILSQHENAENMMEEQMHEMEAKQARLNAELEQLEAAFNLQQEELDAIHKEDESHIEEPTESGTAAIAATEEEIIRVQEVIDTQNGCIRDLKSTVHSLKVDTDTRIKLEEHVEAIERNNLELQTCLQMLELERDRLNSELGSSGQSQMTEAGSEMLVNLDDDI